MSLLEAALLGLIQGLAEPLPVSSQGVVTVVNAWLFDATLTDAAAFSLWLHMGTAFSIIAAFRRDVTVILRDTLSHPTKPTPAVSFLVIATVVSAPLGLLALAGLFEFSDRIGTATMGAVGVMMLATGALLLRRGSGGTRTREDVTWLDAMATGVAQGLAALPGLSRSGLTVSTLLWRKVDRSETLALSFLLSVPASLGAGIYGALKSGAYASPEALAALVTAAIVGFVAIRALIKLAEHVNFGWFVIIVGGSIVGGAAWELLNSNIFS